MLRKLLPVIVVNAFLILLYLGTSYGMWNVMTNDKELRYSGMNAFYAHNNPMGYIINGNTFNGGTFVPYLSVRINQTFNFPFWLFFASTAVNLYFIAKLARSKTA